jgi:hypothetical protein
MFGLAMPLPLERREVAVDSDGEERKAMPL